MKHVFHVGGVLLAAVLFGKCHVGCKPADGPAVSEAVYTAELLSCVDRWQTKIERDVCRVDVNRKWGLCATDGGVDVYPSLNLCGH